MSSPPRRPPAARQPAWASKHGRSPTRGSPAREKREVGAARSSVAAQTMRWVWPTRTLVVVVLALALGALDFATEPWWLGMGAAPGAGACIDAATQTNVQLSLGSFAESGTDACGRAAADTNSSYYWAAADVAGSSYRHAGLQDAVGRNSAGWEKVRFNLRHFVAFMDPSSMCGRRHSSVVAMLTCDGHSVWTNVCENLVPGAAMMALALPCMRPHTGASCFLLAVLGMLLNVWHQFVARGRFRDPSSIDFWLLAAGLLLGACTGALMAWRAPSLPRRASPASTDRGGGAAHRLSSVVPIDDAGQMTGGGARGPSCQRCESRGAPDTLHRGVRVWARVCGCVACAALRVHGRRLRDLLVV
eukprot:SAG25_NODE_684_length_5936_cov_27.949460_3_plen_360_part_00